jgi:transcriptional regulator with XRE-family HTH domain
LSGAELRFLRKNAGFSAQKFDALLVVDPAHLSRVENGKQKRLGASTDRLARLIVVAAARGGDRIRELLLKEAEAEIKRRKSAAAMFTLVKNHWKAAA